MGFLKSIRGFLVSIYQRLKEKVTNAYLVLTGKHKIIGDVVIDATTGEIIANSSFKRIGSSISNFVTDILCDDVFYPKPPDSKGKVIRAISVLGINVLLAAGIISLEGAKFSALLMLKVIVLLYLINVILKFISYVYSFLDRGNYSNPVATVEGEVLAITYDETPVSEAVVSNDKERLAPEEKLEISLLALAIFVAKYSSKGSLVTADVMYCAFVCDPNTLPQGYKMKLHSFFLKHYEELVAISLSIEGEELIPIPQYRAFCKTRMFTKDSVYSKAKYSNEFYEMVKSRK
jgi:hypothetical protein